MLPPEFERDNYRFSFARMDGENLVFSGSRRGARGYVFIGELTVKPTTTKPALHRLFMMLEEQIEMEGR